MDSKVQMNMEDLSPEEAARQSILKQKRILRRYLRLKRNNYVKMHQDNLTEDFFVRNYLPKVEKILLENE
jgi:5-formyltetrahydrofolate cyclo-ligase